MHNTATETTAQLNAIYECIANVKDNIYDTFTELGYNIKCGYFTHHMTRSENEYITELYPIPVITLIDICDIGIDVSHVFIESKISRTTAIRFDFSIFDGIETEIYGVDDCQLDFYNSNMHLSEIEHNILQSKEKEVCIALYFPSDVDMSTLESIVKLMRKNNSYIL